MSKKNISSHKDEKRKKQRESSKELKDSTAKSKKQSKKKKERSAPPALPKPAPLGVGVTLALVYGSPDLVAHARTAVEDDAAHGKRRCGVVMPKDRQVVALHAGPPRAAVQAREYAAISSKDFDESNPKIESIGTTYAFNWASAEGLETLLAHVAGNKRAIITIAQDFRDGNLPEKLHAITRIDAASRAEKTRVIIFASIDKARAADVLKTIPGERIEIEQCEPGPKAVVAFSFKYFGGDLLYPLGLGHKMCELKAKNGRFVRIFTKFVSASLEDRTMWMKRAAGSSLEQIADAVGKNRTTVMRRLRALRKPDANDVVDGWIELAEEMLDLDPSKLRGAAEGAHRVAESDGLA